MHRNKGQLALAAAVVVGWGSFTPSAEAQWRTHYVRRDGLFHVEKYHTGNGITPAFAGMMVGIANAAAPVAEAALGRDTPEDREAKAERDAARAEVMANMAQAQAEANALLDRTARLVNYLPPVGQSQLLQNVGSEAVGTPITPQGNPATGTTPYTPRPQ